MMFSLGITLRLLETIFRFKRDTFVHSVLRKGILYLEGFTLKLFIDSFAQLLYANVLLFLTFSPFVFLSLFITNMVPAMVGGASLTLVNMLIYGQTWAPYVPWVCPYLIASGEIAEYSASVTVSYAIILATFVIGLAISYFYFTKKDVSL